MANEIAKSTPKSGAVTTKQKSIKEMLLNPDTAWGKELAKVLPDARQVAKFMSCAMGQLADPKVGSALGKCTPVSFYNSIMKSARCGIIPDGVNAYLIPYGSVCTLQFSYRGLCDMAIREGIATKFVGDVVRKNDTFKWSNGELVEHTIDAWDEEERGEIVGVWVRAFLPDNTTQDCRMSKNDIEAVRLCSQNPNGVWSKWYDEMAKKACVKRLFKMMRNTPNMAEAIAADNENYNPDKKPVNGKRSATNTLDFGDGDDTQPAKDEGDDKVIDVPAE